MELSVVPQWIARMYPGKVGRDHLGLGSVSSDQILPTLSPGINVLTIHPRYHSFYTFLLDEFWRSDRPRSRSAWVRFYRPREFIFSIGAYLCDRPEHGDLGTVVGGQKTAPLAARQLDAYDTTTNYIKSDLGGYGLYYRSVIAELGLIYPGGLGLPYPVDVPTERGKEVATAFRRAVQDTSYYRTCFDVDDAQVPIDVIREYIRQACLCQLQTLQSPDRPLLLDVFLHGGNESEARRDTLRLLLDIADQSQGYVVDEDTFRQLLYFREAEGGVKYTPQDGVLDAYRRWRLYQAREYYAFALNALWYYLCDWGLAAGGDIRPIPLSRFWQHLEAALDFERLAMRMGVPGPDLRANSSFRGLLTWLQGLVNASASPFDLACRLDAPIHEHRLYKLALEDRAAPEVMVAGMITILALIFLRFGRKELWLRLEWAVSRMGADGRLSVDGFVLAMHRRLRSGDITIEEIARWLYANYEILQHQLIATSKLPDNTFRFRREGNQLRFYNLPNSLGFMNSRFEALSTTLHELGLCGDIRQPDHPLTFDGQQLLIEGDLTWMS
jgi:hypothetical protein